MNVTGTVSAGVQATEQLAPGAEVGQLTLSDNSSQKFANGTAAGQCDLKWSKLRTLAAGASDTWTLSNLTDDLGRAVVFARARGFYLRNTATVDGDDLTVGNAGVHPWAGLTGSGTATFAVKSMGHESKAAMNTAGFPVAAGTSDQLKITNSGANPVTYYLAIVGSSV